MRHRTHCTPIPSALQRLLLLLALLSAGCATTAVRVYEGPPRPRSDVSILTLGSSMNAPSLLAGRPGSICFTGIDGKMIPELRSYPNNVDCLDILPGRHMFTLRYHYTGQSRDALYRYTYRRSMPADKNVTLVTEADHRYEVFAAVTWDYSDWHVKVIDRTTGDVVWDDSQAAPVQPPLQPPPPSTPPPPKREPDIAGLGAALIKTLHPSGGGKVLACYFSPDGKWLVATRASTSQYATNSVYSLETGAWIDLGACGLRGPHNIDFSPDGRLLALQYHPREGTAKVRVCAVPGFAPKLDLAGRFDSIGLLRWMPDSRTLLVGEQSRSGSERQGAFSSWSSETGDKLTEFGVPAAFLADERSRAARARSADGRFLAIPTTTAGDGKNLGRFSAALVRVGPPAGTVALESAGFTTALVFSPDGRMLAGAGGKDIRLWSVPEAKPLRTLRGHRDGVFGLGFSPDGLTLVSGSRDETIRFWDADSGLPLGACAVSNAPVTCLDVSPDGTTVAFGDENGRVTFCDYRELRARAK